MNIREQYKLLSGTKDERYSLFQYLFDKAISETGIDDSEHLFLETLKKEFVQKPIEKQVVTMESTIFAKSSFRG